jgi:hypothetical protein
MDQKLTLSETYLPYSGLEESYPGAWEVRVWLVVGTYGGYVTNELQRLQNLQIGPREVRLQDNPSFQVIDDPLDNLLFPESY